MNNKQGCGCEGYDGNGNPVCTAQPQHSEQQEWTNEDSYIYEGSGFSVKSLGRAFDEQDARSIKAAHNAALSTAQETLRQRIEKAEIENERVLSKTYELHKAEVDRLKANHTLELNAKLKQINKQAETIRVERTAIKKAIVALTRVDACHTLDVEDTERAKEILNSSLTNVNTADIC